MVRDNLGIVNLCFCGDVDIFLPHMPQFTSFVFFKKSLRIDEGRKEAIEHHGTNMKMNFLVEELWKIKFPVYSPLINRISGSREIGYQV